MVVTLVVQPYLTYIAHRWISVGGRVHSLHHHDRYVQLTYSKHFQVVFRVHSEFRRLP